MTKQELHLKYKSETSFHYNPIVSVAYFAKKTFDVVLDSDDLDPRILAQMERTGPDQETTIEFPDPDYHRWLEEKVAELLKT